MYPSRQQSDGQQMQPAGNRYPMPGVPMHGSYPPYGPHGISMQRMWPPVNHQGQQTSGGPMVQEQGMTNQHPYNHGMVRPPHSSGYAVVNNQYIMPPVNSQGPIGQRPPGAPQETRPNLASMLDSPEMIALQQLSASSSHVASFQPTPSGGNTSDVLSPPENKLLGPVSDNQHTPTSPKGR